MYPKIVLKLSTRVNVLSTIVVRTVAYTVHKGRQDDLMDTAAVRGVKPDLLPTGCSI